VQRKAGDAARGVECRNLNGALGEGKSLADRRRQNFIELLLEPALVEDGSLRDDRREMVSHRGDDTVDSLVAPTGKRNRFAPAYSAVIGFDSDVNVLTGLTASGNQTATDHKCVAIGHACWNRLHLANNAGPRKRRAANQR
jgi:hypothetical protein